MGKQRFLFFNNVPFGHLIRLRRNSSEGAKATDKTGQFIEPEHSLREQDDLGLPACASHADRHGWAQRSKGLIILIVIVIERGLESPRF